MEKNDQKYRSVCTSLRNGMTFRVLWTPSQELHPTQHGVTMVIMKPWSLDKDGK
jgi:hypothetical protein